MGEVIELLNYVDGQCLRHLHLMSNIEFDSTYMNQYSAMNGVVTREAGVWHLRAMHPYRGVIDIPAACVEGKARRLVAWSLTGCASVTRALYDATHEFERLFGGRAEFGFMKRLPKAAEHGTPIALRALPPNSESTNLGEDHELILLEAEWMLERCVAVGCKG